MTNYLITNHSNAAKFKLFDILGMRFGIHFTFGTPLSKSRGSLLNNKTHLLLFLRRKVMAINLVTNNVSESGSLFYPIYRRLKFFCQFCVVAETSRENIVKLKKTRCGIANIHPHLQYNLSSIIAL